MSCLITTNTIIDLAKQLEGESIGSVKALIALWQEENNKSLDSYPTIDELRLYKDKIRENKIETKQSQKVNRIINVYWGQAESETSTKILSNLAPRKFSYTSTDGISREYGSVEHAYQSNKNGVFDKKTYDAYVAKGGYGVKIAPILTEEGKKNSLQLMKNLVVESFIQNPQSAAAKKLLEYEEFTHNTNEIIDQAFLEGLKLAQKELLTFTQDSKRIDSTSNQNNSNNSLASYTNYSGGALGADTIVNNRIQQVTELFDSTPELANQIYEALGFSEKLKTSLGKELRYEDPYIPQSRLKDFKKYEVLDENNNNIGSVVIEYRSKNRVILHPKLNIEGKGYGKDLYKFISYTFNVQIAEWNEGSISNSNSAKKMWDSLEKDGVAKRIFDEEQGDNFRVLDYNNQITLQQKQQAAEIYSKYLDTIFPDSKVKDIVYHKTPFSFDKFEKPIEERKLNKLNKSDAIFFNFENKGFFRSKEGAKTISVIVNTTNNKITNENIPYATGSKESIKNLLQEDFDSITVNKTGGNKELLVFEPEQIHILGSKQDIEGFRKFVDKDTLIKEEPSVIQSSRVDLAERRNIDLEFSSQERKNRVELIARFYSTLVDLKYEQRQSELEELIRGALNEKTSQYYQNKLNNLSRYDILNYYTPAGLFNELKNTFINYVNLPIEERIERERNKLIDRYDGEVDIDFIDSDQLEEEAKDFAEYKTQAYQKIINNYNALALESTGILKQTEGLIFNINSKNANIESSTLENISNEEIEDSESESPVDLVNKEDSPKDGWMNDWKHMNPKDSLAKETRRLINSIPRIDSEGYYEEDDLGNVLYLDGDTVHDFLIDKLKSMKSANDLMPLLSKLTTSYPWIATLVDELEKDITLQSKFYRDFRKAPVAYWIHKKYLKNNGTIDFKTIPINKPQGIMFLTDEWRNNQESGTLLNKLSIYDNKGDLNLDNAKINLEILSKLNNYFNREDVKDLFSSKESIMKALGSYEDSNSVITALFNVLNSVGISLNQSDLINVLSNPETMQSNIEVILTSLNIILDGVIKDKFKNLEEGTDDIQYKYDLLTNFKGAYNKIALLLSNVMEDIIEASFREAGASYYSFTVPNYIDRIMKQLQGLNMTEQEFQDFINQEYKQYDFFFKPTGENTGEWLNDWIEQLATNPALREEIQHKVVLNSDKVDYANWDSLDYTLVMLTEYFSEPSEKAKETQFAWYPMPIMSDTESADFIRFRKYTNNMMLSADGTYLTFQDILTDKFVKLVIQEYERIKLVLKRNELFKSGDKSIQHISNFDIVTDSEGNIKNYGGSIFSFLPKLNSYTKNGIFFKDGLDLLYKENAPADVIKAYIGEAIKDVIDTTFEENIKNWNNIKLFETTDDGKYKYLGVSDNKIQHQKTIKALKEVKNLLGDAWTPAMENLLYGYNTNPILIKTALANVQFQKIKTLLAKKLEKGEINSKDLNELLKNLNYISIAKDKLREYFWNHSFATSQIIQIMTTDLAFYKNDGLVDFQKRFHEVKAPATRLNVNSTYGKKYQATLFLKDFISESLDLQSVSDILSKKNVAPNIIADILKALSSINTTDAQAYRTLDSYRSILDMAGKWDENSLEARAFERIKNGVWNSEDFNVAWQVIKPFSFTQEKVDSNVQNINIKKPIQSKNSEGLLLLMYESLMGSNHNAPKLKALNRFMDLANIDMAEFPSAVKVGIQGVIDLNGSEFEKYLQEYGNEEEAALQVLINATGIDVKKGHNYLQGKQGVIQLLDYENYGLQLEVPEHFEDTTIAMGSQIKILVTSDLPSNALFELDKNSLKDGEITSSNILDKETLLKLYENLLMENLIESYEDVENIFKDPKKLESIIQEELRGNPRYINDLSLACSLNENGKFEIPLYESTQSIKVQNLLFSIIKNRIIKQKIAGGALVQTTGYNLTNELAIRYKDDSGNLILTEKEFSEGKDNMNQAYSNYKEYRKDFKASSIAYFEAYLPAYSKVFYEKFMQEGSYEIDANKLPDELRKLIAYRVPTESKYSMIPVYIKGFLPPQAGTRIMLPHDIITLAGIDFDIDKLYILLPEFNKNTLQKIKWDINTDPKNMTRAERNNALLDIMWSILTNKDVSHQLLTPGGFEDVEKAGYIIDILKNYNLTELNIILGNKTEDSGIELLEKLPIDTLKKLMSSTKIDRDPLSPMTQLYFHTQNMTAAKLIGIYANHNVNQGMLQQVNPITIDANKAWYKINGKQLLTLNNMYDSEGKLISKNSAQFLGASVDGVKKPVLHLLNQNTITADLTMLLTRSGYSDLEIALLLNQPIIEEIIQDTLKRRKEDTSIEDVIADYIALYTKKAGSFNTTQRYINYKTLEYKNDSLAYAIIMKKEISKYATDRELTKENYGLLDYYNTQIAIAIMFRNIVAAGEEVGNLTQICKAYTTNGTAGPKIADTIALEKKTINFFAKDPNKSILSNTDVINIVDSYRPTEIGNLRNIFEKSQIPFLQAAYTLGIAKTNDLLGEYFPQYQSSFKEIVDILSAYTKTGKLSTKTIQKILDQIILFSLSKTTLFGKDDNMTAEEKKDYYINQFPRIFNKFISTKEDLINLGFIKNIKYIKAGPKTKDPMDKLVFKTAGKLSKVRKEEYMRDWDYMAYHSDPEIQQMAIELFKYSYFRGLSFGPESFSTLASVYVKKAVPGYLEAVENIQNNPDNYTHIIDQFIRHNLDIRPIVPEITNESSVKFFNEKNEPLDSITVPLTVSANDPNRKFVHSILGEGVILPRTYIAKKYRRDYVYYKVVEGQSDNANIFIYEKIEPLGYKGQFFEYDYNAIHSIQSVIKDKINKPVSLEDFLASAKVPEVSTEQNSLFDRSSLSDAEILNQYKEVLTKDELGYLPDLKDLEKDAELFELQNMSPNTNYLDGENNPICGTIISY